MFLRVITAIVLLAVVALGYGHEKLRWIPIALVMVLGVLCVRELAAMALRRGIVISHKLASAAVALAIYFGWQPHPYGLTFTLGAAMVLAFLARMRRKPYENAWNDVAATLGAIVYAGLPLGAAVEMFARSDATRVWLLLMLTIVWMTDTMALVAGKSFGKHKMAPSLSPGKTWEGAAGGVVGALIAAIVLPLLAKETFAGVGYLELGIVAVVFSALGQAGDLAESMIKRDVGVKDSGTSIPGHGGALDRIDSILFVAMPFAAYLKIAHAELFGG